jgi:hypothetical protein
MTLRDQRQLTLGTTCTLERELGGGGKSWVFLAEDRTRVAATRKRMEARAPEERPRR